MDVVQKGLIRSLVVQTLSTYATKGHSGLAASPLQGEWFMDYGLWLRVWFMVYGLWFMVYGLWFMVYGSWFMVDG